MTIDPEATRGQVPRAEDDEDALARELIHAVNHPDEDTEMAKSVRAVTEQGYIVDFGGID